MLLLFSLTCRFASDTIFESFGHVAGEGAEGGEGGGGGDGGDAEEAGEVPD